MNTLIVCLALYFPGETTPHHTQCDMWTANDLYDAAAKCSASPKTCQDRIEFGVWWFHMLVTRPVSNVTKGMTL